MLFILRYVVLLGQHIDPPQRTTDVVVHSIAKCIVYSTAYRRYEHRHIDVFDVLARVVLCPWAYLSRHRPGWLARPTPRQKGYPAPLPSSHFQPSSFS